MKKHEIIEKVIEKFIYEGDSQRCRARNWHEPNFNLSFVSTRSVIIAVKNVPQGARTKVSDNG